MSIAAQPGLVTVVVASYNHAEFLVQRMDSLIGQTYKDLEILVTDDCSTDDSVGVLGQYRSDPRVILVVREKNGGWVTASNQGLEMATGEFVLFANCDDDCDPRMIERLVGAKNANPTAGIAFCLSLLVDEHDRLLGDDFVVRESSFRVRCASDTLLTRAEMGRFLLHACVIANLSAALIRKACFERVGKFSSSYRVGSDWDLYFRIVAHYDVAYVTEPLNKFRQHKTTISNVTRERVIVEEYFRLLLSRIKEMDLTSSERRRFRLHVMYLWATHILRPSREGLRNFPYHLRRVLSLDPIAVLFLPAGTVLRGWRILWKVCCMVTTSQVRVSKHAP